MKIVLLFLPLLWSLTTVYTINAQTSISEVEVTIDNIPSDEGQMIVSLHDKALNFPKEPSFKKTIKIEDGIAVVTFKNVVYGSYAVTVIHDKNNNKKMDFNFIHIPTEDVAASNNAKGFMGPPSFEDAMFDVDSERVIQLIHLTRVHSSMN